jgi:hypothetical protein
MATLQSPFIPAQPSKPSDPNGIAHNTPKADRAAARTAWVTWVKARYKDYTYRSTGSDPGKFDHTGFTYNDEGGGGGAQTFNIAVTSPGGHYVLNGTDRNGSVSGNNQPVRLNVGDTVNFNVSVSSSHPFYIKTAEVTGTGSLVSTPVATNQGAYNGTVSWTPNTAGTYYYICQNHGTMKGQIIVS